MLLLLEWLGFLHDQDLINHTCCTPQKPFEVLYAIERLLKRQISRKKQVGLLKHRLSAWGVFTFSAEIEPSDKKEELQERQDKD